ncbi:YcaO-like family protein [Photobacterium sp. GJ3]|uniref:YcaO-like family protein n=1 Tax=Photobacterium sp. GJ3 TaxID=2829502 RepID=UPI001B8D896C|nr:YcaO-like family protein [Photobacterium sp. GJ3]QUJ67506.1 YcaO-like family protein [Photobacterium sp. GJ3]
MNYQLSNQIKHVLNRLVDQKTGVITTLIEVPLQATESGIFIFSAQCTDINVVNGHENWVAQETILASGASFDREQALWSTLGEACERYMGFQFDLTALTWANQEQLGRDAVPLNHFVGFSDLQYARDDFHFRSPEEKKHLFWVKGQSLTNPEEKYLPAQKVYLGFPSHQYHEVFFPQVSTGLAAGKEMTHAVLGGVKEVIERDAFSCHWLLRRSPEQIPLQRVFQKIPAIERLIAHRDCDIFLLSMSTEISIPCVLCAIVLPGKSGLALGMACNVNGFAAIEKAVVEACHTLNWVLEMKRDGLTSDDRESVTNFEQHVRFYFEPKHHENLSFLFSGPEVSPGWFEEHDRSFSGERAELNYITDKLISNQVDAYYVDITQPDFAALNIHTVRVIAPQLQPLHVGFGMEYLDEKRLRQFAEFHRMDFPNDINCEPHPFP